MATGLEIYDALEKAIRAQAPSREFTINAIEVYDLQKLRAGELEARGFSKHIAEEVSKALLDGDMGPLARSMGIDLRKDFSAPRLLPE